MKRYVKADTKFHRFGGGYKSDKGYYIEVHQGGSYGIWCIIYNPEGKRLHSGQLPGVNYAKECVRRLENGESVEDVL